FFLYYASPIPHVALQAKEKWVNYYLEKFGDEPPYTGNKGYFPNRYPHASYAAMISTLDEQVGEIIAKLKKLNIEDNTIIIFTSDNGPSYAGGADPEWFDSAKPFKSSYGWAKGFLKEGGIRVPMVVKWPRQINPGTKSDVISCFQDMLPTFLDITNTTPTVVTDGKSLLPALKGSNEQIHPYLYWEFPEYGGQQAVRMGPWKIYRANINNEKKPLSLELFNLENDPQELHDVSAEYPQILDSLLQIMAKEHTVSPLDRFHLKKLGDK
ncbi:MAG: sulfatase-like hydrolase/transferase, partial [Cyclobacteriaceae bacterium]|nr:sulfatase-like hydrolase/transferase [Cyclobacteriaceae bacterium]